LTTIKGELNGEVTIEEIKEALKRGFERALDMRLIKGKLTKWERSKIEEFVQKYRSRKWIFKVP
jgi:lipoate-protein ligase A